MSETTAAPVAETPVATPAPAETPAVVETPVAAAPEPAASASAVQPHTDTPTLMDAPPAEPEKPAVVTPEPVAEAPRYEFKFPEHITREDEAVAAFEGVLGEAKVTPEIAQKLLDMHGQHVAKLADQLLAQQHKTFGDMRSTWRDQVKSDPILGGAGFQTAMKDVAYARNILVPKEHAADFDQFLKVTGAGDNPAFIRMMHNAAKFLKEPAPVQAGTPPKDIGASPKGGWRGTLYPTMQKKSG